MSDFRTATRYAKSALDLSLEMKVLEKVHADMVSINALIQSSHELRMLLQSPIVKDTKKGVIIDKIFKNKVNDLTLKFLDLVVRKGRASALFSITEQFQRQYRDYKGIQEAEVTTTFKLDDKLRKEFDKVVADLTKKTASVKEHISEDIIGGFILDIGDKRIDASIKTNLEKIEYELTH
jgi:F-type H+-transporting ATPase subunit delta